MAPPKRVALERLLAIAPALEAAGVEPMSEEEIAAEVEAVRKERRAKTSRSNHAKRQTKHTQTAHRNH